MACTVARLRRASWKPPPLRGAGTLAPKAPALDRMQPTHRSRVQVRRMSSMRASTANLPLRFSQPAVHLRRACVCLEGGPATERQAPRACRAPPHSPQGMAGAAAAGAAEPSGGAERWAPAAAGAAAGAAQRVLSPVGRPPRLRRPSSKSPGGKKASQPSKPSVAFSPDMVMVMVIVMVRGMMKASMW